MIKIIYKFCQQGTKQLDLFKQITSLPPTYANFRKLNISFDESLRLFDLLYTKKTHQSAQILNNLLTYVRKVHNRAVVRSRQHLIEHIIKYMPEKDFEMLPSLLSNIYYTENPEKFLGHACGILLQQAPLMDVRIISNCVYSAAKIARKNIRSDLQQEKAMLYGAVNLALKNLIPIIQLKLSDCQDPQTLMEIMVAYSKMEIPELFENIINQLSTFTFTEFGRVETQILYTTIKSGIESPAKIALVRKLYDCLEDAVHEKKISLPSMIVGLHTIQQEATEDLIKQCITIYCEKYKTANIMDLGMMTNVLFRKGIITAKYSQILTESFEALKQNVDMNTMMLMIQNISTMINLKLLEKKFLNMFLISARIMAEKGKINRRFYEDFRTQTRQIENEEIKEKFQQIERLMMA